MTAMTLPRIAELALTQFWQVTLLAVVVGLVVRLAARRRPHLAYLLWMVVVVKCLTPPIVSSPTSLFSWAQFNRMQSNTAGPQVNAPPAAIATAEMHDRNDLAKRATKPRLPSALVGADKVESASADAEKLEPASIAATPSVSSTTTAAEPVNAWLQPAVVGAAIVWLAGVAIFSAIIAVKWLRTRGLLNRCATASASVERQLAVLAQRLQVRRQVKVLVSSEHIGPAVFGVLRPTILLPAQVVLEARPADLEPILAHELIHVRRGDAAASLLQLAAQLAWWFHPLVWWINREARRERERACDEEVVAGLGYPPARYARVLVNLLDALVRQRQPFALAGVPMLEVTARRLTHIVREGKHFHARAPRWQWPLAAVLLLIVLPGAGLTWEREPAVPADESATIIEPVSKPGTESIEVALAANNVNGPKVDETAIAAARPTEPKFIPAASDADSAAHRKAVAEIQKLGGVVQRTRLSDGTVFVTVALDKEWKGGDTDLALLKDVKDLKQVMVDCRRVAPEGISRLGQLADLESVNLSNATNEQIARLQACAKIKSVMLQGEKITDAGLGSLSTLPNLNSLAVFQTAITDESIGTVKHIAGLNSLQIGLCPKFTGGTLGELAVLPKLEVVAFIAAPLSREGVAELAKLQHLNHVVLDASRLKSPDFAPLGNLSTLKKLTLQNATSFDDAAVHFEKLAGLQELIINESNLTDAGLAHLPGLKSLTSLMIYQPEPRFTDAGLASLKALEKLRSLSLSKGRFTDAGLAHLKDLRQIRLLELGGKLDVTDKGLASLAAMTQLKSLSLNQSRITDNGLSALATLEQLASLDLSQTQITGAGLAKLSILGNLRDLNLSGSRVNDDGLANVAQLVGLEVLNLDATSVTDAGLAAVAELPKLRDLSLLTTKVGDAGLDKLALSKSLRELAVTNTNVTQAGIDRLKKKLPGIDTGAKWRVSFKTVDIPATEADPPLNKDDKTTSGPSDERPGDGGATSNATSTEPKTIPSASDADSAAHRRAVAEIEKLGGVVQRVRMPDGKKFVSIGLAEKWTGGDEGVDLLTGVSDLKFVSLDCRRFKLAGVARLGKLNGLESVHLLNPTDAQLAGVQGWQVVQSLVLEGGTFTDAGLPPLSTLPGLKDLSFVSAAITDDSMDKLRNLAALEKLQVSVCSKLSGSKLGSLAMLPNLHDITIMVTPLSADALSELAKLPRLARLTLDASKFKSEDFAALGKMPHLVHLMLNQAVTFDDAAAANLAKMTGLRNLILYNTSLTDAGLVYLRELKSLETLLLQRDDGHFTDQGLANLAVMKNLQTLSLGHGHFTDEGLAHLRGLTQLRGFSLTFSLDVTDDGVASLGRMTHLKNLSLSGAALTDVGLARLAAMTELEQLDFSQSQVTGAGFAKLASLKQLSDLNLSGTKMTDAGLANLAHFKNLEALDLTGTAVTDAGLAVVATLPRLQRLMLERTKITDAGLLELGGIKTLRELGLGGTKVSKAGMAGLKKKLPEIEIAADDVVFIKDMNIPPFDVPPPPPPSDGGAKP